MKFPSLKKGAGKKVAKSRLPFSPKIAGDIIVFFLSVRRNSLDCVIVKSLCVGKFEIATYGISGVSILIFTQHSEVHMSIF